MKKALITGVNGQDGSYLTELLLEKGYEVHGIVRRNSVPEVQSHRLNHIYKQYDTKFQLHYGDVTDFPSLLSLLQTIKPDEIYHLAAQSHVQISFNQPVFTTQVNAIGTLNLLEAVRLSGIKTRIYNAGSSEMFGNSIDADGYQRETTPMHPVSPYGCSKLYAYSLCKNYRQAYGMWIANGILFNHESPRRGTNFVTNKVVEGYLNAFHGKNSMFKLGNIKASRDWGYAPDYVKGMWLMLNQDKPDDYVLATGQSRTVEELCQAVHAKVGLFYDWHKYVLYNDVKYLRPEELNHLKGDYSKAERELGWYPETSFDKMIEEMVVKMEERILSESSFQT